MAPRFTASGTNFSETEPPAEKNAISIFSKLSGTASSIVNSVPATVNFLPADLLEDRSFKSLIAKGSSSNNSMIFCPTAPVATTTATLYCLLFDILTLIPPNFIGTFGIFIPMFTAFYALSFIITYYLRMTNDNWLYLFFFQCFFCGRDE